MIQSDETGRWWLHVYDQADGETIVDELDVCPRGTDPYSAWSIALTRIAEYVTESGDVEVQSALPV